MKKVIKESIGIFVGALFVMIMISFAIIVATLPVILAAVYDNGWYLLLYFIFIPTFFATLPLFKYFEDRLG